MSAASAYLCIELFASFYSTTQHRCHAHISLPRQQLTCTLRLFSTSHPSFMTDMVHNFSHLYGIYVSLALFRVKCIGHKLSCSHHKPAETRHARCCMYTFGEPNVSNAAEIRNANLVYNIFLWHV